MLKTLEVSLTVAEFDDYWFDRTDMRLSEYAVWSYVLNKMAEGLTFKQIKNLLHKNELDKRAYYSEADFQKIYSQYREFAAPQTVTIAVEKTNYANGAAYYYNSRSCLWGNDNERKNATKEWMNDPRSYAILVHNQKGTVIARCWLWKDYNGVEVAFNPYGLTEELWSKIFDSMGLTYTSIVYVSNGGLYLNRGYGYSNVNARVPINFSSNLVYDYLNDRFAYQSEVVKALVAPNVWYSHCSSGRYSEYYSAYISGDIGTALMPNGGYTYVFTDDAVFSAIHDNYIIKHIAVQATFDVVNRHQHTVDPNYCWYYPETFLSRGAFNHEGVFVLQNGY